MQIIENILKKIINTLYSLKVDSIALSNPPKAELWDYAFGCFLLAHDTKKAPPQIALEIKAYFDDHKIEYAEIESMEVAWGYLNFQVSNKAFTNAFFEAVKSEEIYANFEKKNETVVVDYIGVNVGKPLHIGHMCTPNIGQSLVNLYKKLGYNVISDSHIGDWGIIFGKLIFAYKLFGSEEKLKENAIDHLLELYIKISQEIESKKGTVIELIWDIDKTDRISKSSNISQSILNKIKNDYTEESIVYRYESLKAEGLITEEIKSKISELYKWSEIQKQNESEGSLVYSLEQQTRHTFKLLSEGNPKSIKMWEKFTRESIRFMNIQLARLNVKPDYNIWESFYEGLGLPKMENYPDLKWDMKSIVSELIRKGVATKNDDGSVGVIFPEETKLPSCILQKRDGTHGYLASDLATIKYRSENWSPAKIVYSVDIRQELHLKQAFYIAKVAGWVDHTELFHAANGFISLKDGAMSTRTGKIIRLEALLDEAEERAKKIILEKRQDIQGKELEKLAHIIGVGAIKYGYLSKSRLTNVVFDWDEFMTFEGNSGPYIQYAYVRAKSVLWDDKIVIPNLIGNPWNVVWEKEQSVRYTRFRKDDKTKNILSSASFETPEEKELIKALFEYENILIQVSRENFPHIIAGYAYELTKKFNSLYAKVPLQNEEDEGKRNMRLQLVSVFSNILRECFSILAIEMPERM